MFCNLSVKMPISIKNTSLLKKKKKKEQKTPDFNSICLLCTASGMWQEPLTHSAALLTTRKFHTFQTFTLGQQGRNQL